MSSASLSSSSSAAASASTASPSPTSSSSSSSPPIFVGFIGISVLTFCLVSLLMWRKLSGRNYRHASNTNPSARLPQNVNVFASGRPELFDAWMGERASDSLKWEKSMPFSVTILTDAESNRTSHAIRKGKAGKHRGNSVREREEQDAGSACLRAAVLVAMPSPLHAQSHVGHAASGSSLRDELAIGLIEMPWNKEGHHSLKRNVS